MIVRIWRGMASRENADKYREHFATSVCPELATLDGHRGACLLRREAAGSVEFLAVTMWESLDAIRAFAGDRPETAVVEPAARAVLAGFEEVARHYEVAHTTGLKIG